MRSAPRSPAAWAALSIVMLSAVSFAAPLERSQRPVESDRVGEPAVPEVVRVPGVGVFVPRQLRLTPTIEVRGAEGLEALETVDPNVRANDTSGDPAGITNSETTIAALGNYVLTAWNDGLSFGSSPGGTGYAYSSDGGLTFTDGGVPPVTAPNAIHYGDPCLTVDNAGHFYLADLYALNAVDFGVAVMHGTFSGSSFTWDTPVVVSSSMTDGLDKEWIAADRVTGDVYAAWTNFLAGGGNRIEFSRSTDHGATWSAPLALTSPGVESCQGARVAVGPDHEIQVIYIVYDVATGNNYMRTRRSTDGGVSFDPEVTLPTGPSGIISNFGSGPPGFNRAGGIGFPSLAIDNSLGPYRGRVYATWEESVNFFTDTLSTLDTLVETESNNIWQSADLFTVGQMVSGSLGSNTDIDFFKFSGTAGQTVILYLVPAPDASTQAYLRLYAQSGITGNQAAYSYLGGGQSLIVYTPPANTNYYVRVARAENVTGDYEIHTGLDSPDPGDEVARDARDVIVQSSADGVNWDPRIVGNDDAALYDNAFPEIAVSAAGYAYIDWYDFRNSSYGLASDIYYTRSNDGGASFLTGVKVNDGAATNWNNTPTNLIPNMGDYSALVADGCNVYANWADGRQNSPDSWVAKIHEGIPAPSATALAADTTMAALGDTVNFTATVAPFGAGGTVQFRDGINALGSPVAVDGGGVAMLSVDTLSAGMHSITAEYGGNACFAMSVSDKINVEVAGPTAVPALVVADFALGPPTPNPSIGTTWLEFTVARAALVRLSVLDLQGREVAVLASGFHPAGRYQAVWNTQAARVPAGVYFARFRAPGKSVVRRVVVMGR